MSQLSMFIAIAAANPDAAEVPGLGAQLASLIIPLALMVAVFYFFLIRPQKKREKQTQQMQNSLQVGDEIVTTGGIVGIVVSIKEDTVVLETANDRSKIRIKRWAIASNETVHDDKA